MMRVILAVAIMSLMGVCAVWAAIPQTISYQGVLTDGAGGAVQDGNVSLIFKIYDVSAGGTALWTEAQIVSVSGGIFNVELGSGVALTLDFDEPYWLGVTYLATEFTPRRELTASPYSLNSQGVVGSANVFKATGNVGIGTTTPSAPLEVNYTNNSPSTPSIIINNSSVTGYELLDFRFLGAPQARIMKRNGAEMVVGTTDDNDLKFMTAGNPDRMTIKNSGNVSIGPLDPVEKLDVQGGLKISTTSNTNSGTLRWTGTDFEGYNGSSWKSLTGGAGGNLPTGVNGQTLRHNGADWVAVSNLYNSGTSIGIGTIAPASKLHIRDDINSIAAITIENQDVGAISGERLDFRDENGSVAGIATYDNDHASYASQMRIFNNRPGGSVHLIAGAGNISLDNAGNAGIGTMNPAAKLHVEGALYSGSSTQDGRLSIFRMGLATPVVDAFSDANGGNMRSYDELGNTTIELLPDNSGTGGILGVRRNTAFNGFEVNGNWGGSEEPRVGIYGSARAAIFQMDLTGNSSVSLPTNAVSSTEMFDEPGVASDVEGVSSVVMDGTVQTLLSRSITVPAAGYVLVIGTCQPLLSHSNGTASWADFGVSDVASSFPDNQDVSLYIASNAQTGSYYFPVTVHGLFQVTAGTKTFYFLGDEGSGVITVYDMQLSLVYIPTSYGTVTPTLVSGGNVPDDQAGTRGGLTAGEIAAERMESEASNRARIDRELAAMRAEIEAMREELRRERQN